MKNILLASFAALMLLAACTKDDTNDDDATPTPTPQPTSAWDWTGTAPLSMKMDGTTFQTAPATINVDEAGKNLNIHVSDTGDLGFSLNLGKTIEAGKEYAVPTEDYGSYAYVNARTGLQMTAKSGAYKILKMTATEIEGLFYGTLKDFTGITSKDSIVVTQGYFKVNR